MRRRRDQLTEEEQKDKLTYRLELIDGLLVILSEPETFISLIRNAGSRADARALVCNRYGVHEAVADRALDAKAIRMTDYHQEHLRDERREVAAELAALNEASQID